MAKGSNILKSIPPMGWIAIVGVPVLYFGVLDPILKKLGLKDSNESKEEDKNIKAEEKAAYWSPLGWAAAQKKAGKPVTTISQVQAGKLSDQIENAFGTFNDHEEKIIGAFKSLKTKWDVSFLVYVYNKFFETDLYSELKSRLSSTEFNSILNIVKNLK